MPTAIVDKPGCRVRLHSGRLLIYAPSNNGVATTDPMPLPSSRGSLDLPHTPTHEPSETPAAVPAAKPDNGESLLIEFPIGDLQRVLLHEQTHISMPALCALLHAHIPIGFLSWHGRFLGGLHEPAPAESATRLLQYRRTLDAAFALTLARQWIAAKIYNQLRLLQRANANRPRLETKALDHLAAFQNSVPAASDLASLRGVEGASTAEYFALWAGFLPPEFPFERRSARPPHNAVNACISFGSALVYGEFVSLLHARGLDPGLGLLDFKAALEEPGRFKPFRLN